jgi:hypothetical protein
MKLGHSSFSRCSSHRTRSLLADARAGFDDDLDDERDERASDATALRFRECVRDMTEVVLDAIDRLKRHHRLTPECKDPEARVTNG